MSGEITVTRGYTFVEGERIDYDKLNQAAAPSARLDADSVGADELLLDGGASDAGTALKGALMAVNLFRNPALDWNKWRYPDGILCPTGEKTENALGWLVSPSGTVSGEEDGNGLTASRSTKAPDDGEVSASLELRGYDGITAVRVLQQVPGHVVGVYASSSGGGNATGVAASVWVYNGTGSDFTMSWEANSPTTSIDGFDSVSGTGAVPYAVDCAASAWTQLTGAPGNLFNTKGLEMNWVIPSGSLDSSEKVVRFAQFQLVPGSTAGQWVPPQPESFRHVYGRTRVPTVDDDCASGFGVGSQWYTTTEVYQCLDASEGAAIWEQMTLEIRHVLTLAHQQASGTDGGTATSGSWETEPINTILEDTGNLSDSTVENPVVIDANGAFTLPRGLWQFEAEVPRYAVNGFQARLYDVDNGAVAHYAGSDEDIYGTTGYASAANTGHAVSVMRGRIQLTTVTKLRIECQVAATQATNGKGYASSVGTETYAFARFTLISL